jgi:hypothetical protein
VQGHIFLFLPDLPPSNGDNGEGASERFIFEKEGQRCKVAKEGVKTTLLHTIGATMQLAHIYIYIYSYLYKGQKEKTTSRIARGYENMEVGRRLVPRTSARGMNLSQPLQDDAHHLQYLLSLV